MAHRPPKSSRIHLLNNEKLYGKLKDRVDAEPTQKDKTKIPVCPAAYTKPEREIWQQYADILVEYDLFNLANGQILNLLVRNIADRNKCVEHVKTDGICIDNGRGLTYNPYFSAKNKCEENIMKYLNMLGLSSMGLAKLGGIHAERKEKDSEMESLLDEENNSGKNAG